jgi:hypothetical protein
MPWTYHQATGQLLHNGVVFGAGYSGAGIAAATGRNNPAMQATPFQGPIPAGQYTIGVAYNHPTKGPNSMNLAPVGHNALGRTDFMIHGNNVQNNASQGCVIMGPAIRLQISNSGDNVLNVVP